MTPMKKARGHWIQRMQEERALGAEAGGWKGRRSQGRQKKTFYLTRQGNVHRRLSGRVSDDVAREMSRGDESLE